MKNDNRYRNRVIFFIAIVMMMSMVMLTFPLSFTNFITREAQAQTTETPIADFNGDGFADLAIGVPGEDIGTIANAGAVNVIYGSSSSGLSSTNNQFWSQNSAGIADSSEAHQGLNGGDTFGYSLAAGDFDNDGFSDLAIGVPYEQIGTGGSAIAVNGAVNVIYGSSSGLTSTGNQLWSQNSPGIPDSSEDSDQFGYSLAAGDFDNDGFADLAIGVPSEDIETGGPYAGAVNVIYGSSSGLTSTGNQLWSQNSPGIADSSENVDNFGHSLAAGDFDNDGFSDLAIGVFNEALGSVTAGAVNVIYGSSSSSGLTSEGNQFWHQNSPGIADTSESNDYFGHSLAAGDFDNDDFADLAIGVSGEDIGTINEAGAVNVIYGSSSSGLTSEGNQFWHQNRGGIADTSESNNQFGHSLAAGDFDNDDFADLAIGVRGEDIGDLGGAGAVNVIYGSSSSSGLTSEGNQFWSQNSAGIADSSVFNEYFGYSLAAGDFDNDDFADLAIGVPYEDIGTSAPYAGAVNVIYGSSSSSGLTSEGNQFWHQSSPGIADSPEQEDNFGWSLASTTESAGTSSASSSSPASSDENRTVFDNQTAATETTTAAGEDDEESENEEDDEEDEED